jgi:hypothetical protein
MPTCPNGHQSGLEDWCEVCGHPMAAAGATAEAVSPLPPPPQRSAPGGPGNPGAPAGGYGYPNPNQPPPPPIFDPHATAQAELCPQCRTPREALAPFCEECRYNFLTHSPTITPPAPPPPPPAGGAPLPPGFRQPPPPQFPHGLEYQSSRPSQINRPAEPLAPEPPQDQYAQPHHSPSAAGSNFRGEDDWTLPPPAPAGHAPQYPQAPQPVHGAGWVAVVAPDREYFMAMMGRSGPEAASLNLPAYSPEQQHPLTGGQVTIGRRRNSTGECPDIDLSRSPEDPGVSHRHATIAQQPDGSWAVIDQDSTNGTTINGAEEPIRPFAPVPLREGDRVHVGAWTTITVRRG